MRVHSSTRSSKASDRAGKQKLMMHGWAHRPNDNCKLMMHARVGTPSCNFRRFAWSIECFSMATKTCD